MNTVEVSNVLETSPKLYEMYIKYVFSMHKLTVDSTHTWYQEGTYYNFLAFSLPQHKQS
jgi:hypothetical protein